jgi:TPR repeat protein
MTILSLMYLRGEGCDVDLVKSFEWLRRSAEEGYAEAFRILAEKYRVGEGCEIDLIEADRWEEKNRLSSGVA